MITEHKYYFSLHDISQNTGYPEYITAGIYFQRGNVPWNTNDGSMGVFEYREYDGNNPATVYPRMITHLKSTKGRWTKP